MSDDSCNVMSDCPARTWKSRNQLCPLVSPAAGQDSCQKSMVLLLLLKAKLIFVTLRIIITRLNFLRRFYIGDFLFNMWINLDC